MIELKNSKKTYLGKTLDSKRNRFALDVPAGDPTLEVQVGASEDDAEEIENDGSMYLDVVIVRIMSGDASTRRWSGFRFVSEEFPPQGTTIDVAYLRGYLYSASYDDANFNLHFEELAAPLAFTIDKFNITSRDRTEASVPWIADGIAAGGVGWYNSPSLCGVGSPIQELFDAYSPTAIVAIARPNQDVAKHLRFRTWDEASHLLGAILHLEWEEAPEAIVKVADETIGLSEAAIGRRRSYRFVPESIAISESALRRAWSNRIFSEAVSIADSLLRKGTRSPLITAETINLSDSGIRVAGMVRVLDEVVSISDSALKTLHTFLVKVASETIGITDSGVHFFRAILVKIMTEVIGLLDSMSYMPSFTILAKLIRKFIQLESIGGGGG